MGDIRHVANFECRSGMEGETGMKHSIRRASSRAKLPMGFAAACVAVLLAPAAALAFGPGVALPSHELDPVCRSSGNRIVVVYSHRPSDVTPTPTATLRSIVKRMNWKVSDQSSLASQGKRVLRLPVDCNAEGQINVYNVATANNYFSTLRSDARVFGSPTQEKAIKYLVFEHAPDESSSPVFGQADGGAPQLPKSNANNAASNTGVAVIYSEVWENHVTLHELLHTMGAVSRGDQNLPPPPGSDLNGHCSDGWDIMCSDLSGWKCPESQGYNQPDTVPIDCGKDTYFNPTPAPGTWLDTYWNLGGRENWFLVASPKATTEAATSVRGLSARMHGVVDPEGTRTSYYFEYGKTTSYGSKTPSEDVGFGGGPRNEGPLSVEYRLEKLPVGTTYHFRLVAVNIDGTTVKGEDKTFTTASPKLATVTTEPAGGLSLTEATLKGTINPNGSNTLYEFEYGKTTEYGTTVPLYDASEIEMLLYLENQTFLEEWFEAGMLTPQAGAVQVSRTISGLKVHGTYHYRLKAISEAGTAYGGDKTFTTLPDVKPPTLSFSFGSAGTGNGQFTEPRGVAIDSQGNAWVVDRVSGAGRVEKFNSKGEYLSQFGSAGKGNGQFSGPRGIAIDKEDNLYVLDTGNVRVQKFNSKGEYLSQFTSPLMFEITGIAVDPQGNIWVDDDENGLLKFNSKGELLLRAGTKFGTGDGQLREPQGLATDADGNVWVADQLNNRVQKFAPNGEFVAKFGSGGVGDGQFGQPRGLAVDARGTLWIPASSQGRVEEIFPEPEYASQFGSAGSGAGQFKTPTAAAADAAGNIWVVDTGNKRVQVWKQPPASAVETEAPTGVKRTEGILNATVNPQGKATSYQFEYGTTDSFGKVTPAAPKSIGSGSSGVKVSEALNGLSAGKTYYYRVVAATSSSTVYGETRSFKTMPGPGAEAKWRVGGKTFAELGLKEEAFSTSGSYAIEIPQMLIAFKCTQSGNGTLAATGSTVVHMTLNCSIPAVPACKVQPIKMDVDGNFKGINTNLALIESTGCGLSEITILPNGSSSFEYGSEATKMSVTGTHTTTYGAHPVYITGSSYWQLSGANAGKPVGYW
jgi:streptogramin lyase